MRNILRHLILSNRAGRTSTKPKTTGLPTGNWKKLIANIDHGRASTHIPSAGPSRSSSSASARLSTQSEFDDQENDSFHQSGTFDEDEPDDVVAAARESKSRISIHHGRPAGDHGQSRKIKSQVCILAYLGTMHPNCSPDRRQNYPQSHHQTGAWCKVRSNEEDKLHQWALTISCCKTTILYQPLEEADEGYFHGLGRS